MSVSRRVLCFGGVSIAASLASFAFAQSVPVQTREMQVEQFLLTLRGEARLQLAEGEELGPSARLGDIADPSTLQALAANFTNFRGSNVMMQSQRLPLGILAYETLTSLVYHEETDEAGDLVADWPGYLEASPARLSPFGGVATQGFDLAAMVELQLPLAQQAWKDALDKGSFILL